MYTNHIFSFKSKESQRNKMNNTCTMRGDAFLKQLVFWNIKGQDNDYKKDGTIDIGWKGEASYAYEEHTGKFWWWSVMTKMERTELTGETQDDPSLETKS